METKIKENDADVLNQWAGDKELRPEDKNVLADLAAEIKTPEEYKKLNGGEMQKILIETAQEGVIAAYKQVEEDEQAAIAELWQTTPKQ